MAEPPENHVHPLSRADWRSWLAANHDRGEGVWFVFYKKAAGKPTLTVDDMVEEAIAFGWIDSVPKRIDAERAARWISPRKAGSNWSRLSRQRAARMEAAGLMTEAGRAAIDRAHTDGTWTALDDIEDLVVPDDLEVALSAHPPARDEWDAFPPSRRRAILEWIASAKRDATRAARIVETAQKAQIGERANEWKRKG